MHELSRQWLDDLANFNRLENAERSESLRRAAGIADAPVSEVKHVLDGLLDMDPELASRAEPLVAAILENLHRRCITAEGASAESFSAESSSAADSSSELAETLRQRAVPLYEHLTSQSGSRYLLLKILLSLGTPADLRAFVERLVREPPDESKQILEVLTPLFRRPVEDCRDLFPRLLDGLAHAQLASPLLDLANFYTRRGLVEEHPARDRAEQLGRLLGEIAQRLAQLEENPHVDAATAEVRSRTVDESVSLVVSLCDALSLIGDASVAGKIYQVVELKHRRLRTEAAAALVQLGEPHGKKVLVETAAEPVARLRVLAYAEELGMIDAIPTQFTTPVARAEAELALHLAQPTVLGFPPTECELVDERRQFWPSYDDPVDCFLFLYVYRLGGQQYSNVGIVGPLTHTFTANLADLPPADIYATFAGWQTEHEQIRQWHVDHLSDLRKTDVSRLERRITDEGYQLVQSHTLGSFFGEKTLVAEAKKDGAKGYVVADSQDIYWHAEGPSSRPFSHAEVYCLYKGRKLLSTFNSP